MTRLRSGDSGLTEPPFFHAPPRLRTVSGGVGLALLAAAVGLGIGLAAATREWAFAGALLVGGMAAAVALSSYQQRFWAVWLAIPLAAVSFAKYPVPLSIFPYEMVLFAVVFAEIVARRHPARRIATLPSRSYVLPVLFAAAGLVAAVAHGEIAIWHWICLIPLVVLFLMSRLIVDTRHAWLYALAAAVGAALAVFTVYVGRALGLSHGFAGDFRLGSEYVAFGPVRIQYFAVTFGTLVALVLPLVVGVLLGMRVRVLYRVLGLAGMAVLFLLLFLTGARGATVGGLAGAAITALLCGGLRRGGAVVVTLLVAGVLLVSMITASTSAPDSVAARFPQVFGRFSTLAEQGVVQQANLQVRLRLFRDALEHVPTDPLGRGFNYNWTHKGVDEAIVYSMLINGTGVAGALLWIGVIMQFSIRMIAGLRRTGEQRLLASVGLGTIVVGLVAGVASESVLAGSLQSVVLWTLLSVAYVTSGAEVLGARS